MFDNEPITSNTQAAGANTPSVTGSGARRNIHWIGNVFNPDTMPADDISKYVVPKEQELVWDLQGTVLVWYFVYKVYQNKSDLRLCEVYTTEGQSTEDQDAIFGAKGGPLNGEGIMAVDYSQRPNRASIDATIARPGAAYALLFLGDNIDVDNGGVIISAVYDKSANLINNQVPVQLAAINNYTNKTVMTTGAFSVTKNADGLPNGSRCTLVFFDQGDMVITPSQRIVVQQSSYLRNRVIGMRYVLDIELISPWFTDSGDPDKLILPVNTPLVGIEFRAVVHYNNGDKEELTVNGDKFQLLGINKYRPSAPGETAELSLIYTLSEDEQFYLAQPGVDGRKTRVYQIMAGAVEGAYGVKLYTYPTWVQQGSLWGLKHFMYDLDRKTFRDVTDKVTINESSPVFNPSNYNSYQNMTFNLILKDVDPKYNATIYKQQTSLVLYKDINGPGKRWGVQYSQDKPIYDGLMAKTVNNGASTTVNLTNGFTNVDDWLAALYWSVIPSFDSFNEEKAPTPNVFYVMTQDGKRYPQKVSDWNKPVTIGASQLKGQTLFVCWAATDATGNEKQLALTGVTVDTSV